MIWKTKDAPCFCSNLHVSSRQLFGPQRLQYVSIEPDIARGSRGALLDVSSFNHTSWSWTLTTGLIYTNAPLIHQTRRRTMLGRLYLQQGNLSERYRCVRLYSLPFTAVLTWRQRCQSVRSAFYMLSVEGRRADPASTSPSHHHVRHTAELCPVLLLRQAVPPARPTPRRMPRRPAVPVTLEISHCRSINLELFRPASAAILALSLTAAAVSVSGHATDTVHN